MKIKMSEKRRNYYTIGILLLTAITYGLAQLPYFVETKEEIIKSLMDMKIFLIILIVIFITRKLKPEVFKKQDIEENDERIIQIRYKAANIIFESLLILMIPLFYLSILFPYNEYEGYFLVAIAILFIQLLGRELIASHLSEKM